MEEAFKRGARFDAWTEHFKEDAWRDAAAATGIDVDAVAQRSFDVREVLPWQHISCGVSLPFLRVEHARALKGTTTPDCTFGTCTACGLCPSLGVDIQTQEVRHG